MVENEKRRKYIKIAEQIKQDILDGTYKTGNNIPAVKKLSEMYNVNPQTICKATAYLSSLGHLNPIPGSGIKVCVPKIKTDSTSIALLMEKSRKSILDLEKLENYHFKDIYLAFFMHNQKNKINGDLLVFDKDLSSVDNKFLRSLANKGGLLVHGNLPECYFHEIEEMNIPIVLINRTIPAYFKKRIGSIMISDKMIGIVVNYLITLGHNKILYAISNDFENSVVVELRYKAIMEACQLWKNEIDIEIEVFEFKSNDPESSEKLKALMEKGFSAALGFNDFSALALYSLLRMINKRVPNDFSVVGFDDIVAARISVPSLTTIKVDRFALVEMAFNLLSTLVLAPDNEQITKILDTELIIRRSTLNRIGNNANTDLK